MYQVKKDNFVKATRGTDVAYCTAGEFNTLWQLLGWEPECILRETWGVRLRIGGAVGDTEWDVYATEAEAIKAGILGDIMANVGEEFRN